MKRIITISLLIAIVLSLMALSAGAESETVIMPRYSYVDILTSSLSINKNTGLTTCNATSSYHGGASQKLTCKLQRYDGSTWTTVKTWTKTSTMSVNIAQQYAVYSGYTYRLRTTCKVYNSAGTILEIGICDSNQVKY